MTNQINNKYFKRFCENLEALGLTYEEVERDYKYSGGNLDEEGCETRHSRYFDMCFPRDPFPDKVKKCMCDHPIVENCYISKDFDINTLLIIGNCCIKKFIKASSRTCEVCQKSHRNTKTNYCNDCKDTYKKCNHCKVVNITGKSNYCSTQCLEEHTYFKCKKCKILKQSINKFNKCISCAVGRCSMCNIKVDPKWKICYPCNLIKKNNLNLN